jgi:hypothetical protein
VLPSALIQSAYPARTQQALYGLQGVRAEGYRGWAVPFIAKAIEMNRIVVPVQGVNCILVLVGNILCWKY